MTTRDDILAAALKVLEEEGGGQFTTRAVCAIAKVSAPTLYHYFGNADGLLSAAVTEAFRQFLASKLAAVVSPVPEIAVQQGWDDYVRFAAARPRLYAAMMARWLDGAPIEAAEQGHAKLVQNLEDVEANGRLAVPVADAADMVLASANAAALLYLTAHLKQRKRPEAAVIARMRDAALATILSENDKTL